MKVILLALFSVGSLSPAMAAPPLIAQAYEDDRRHLLVRMQDDQAAFPSGNIFFYGDDRSLRQLDPAWISRSADRSAVDFESGELELAALDARLKCGDRESRFQSLGEAARRDLNRRLAAAELSLVFLPEVLEPSYFFRVEGAAELVLIKTPHYNFRNQYEVWMGKRGRLRRIATKRSMKTGLIPFADGGGIYLPIEIDLFKSVGNKGDPTLLLAHPSRLRRLLRPTGAAPPQAAWFRALLRRPRLSRIATPCDHSG